MNKAWVNNQYLLHYNVIKKYLPNNNIKVLEAGSSTAYFMMPFAKDKSQCYCIDNNQKELEKGINLFKENNLKAEFKNTDILNINYSDNFFDVVFSHGVFEHFVPPKERNKALQEMKRVSKKYVYASVPNKNHSFVKETFEKEVEPNRINKTGELWEKVYFPFGFRELEECFEENGLRVVESFGSLHWFNHNFFLAKTIGKLISFELCILGEIK